MKMTASMQNLPVATRRVIIWGSALVVLFVALGLIRGSSRVQLPVS